MAFMKIPSSYYHPCRNCWLILAGVTIVFARASQVYALRRDLSRGKTKEQYRKRQVIWAITMGILAAVMLGAATYYNLVIRPTIGA